MHVLLDHLAATIVGTVVVLIVVALLFGGQTDAVDQTRRDVHLQQARTLSVILEDDLRNAGAGVPPSAPALLSADSTSLAFRRKKDFGSSPVETVAYDRVPDGTIATPDGPVTAYAVERSIDGTVRQRFGGLTDLSFELRDADGAPTTDLTAGRAVHVRYAFGADAGAQRPDLRARYRRSIPMDNLASR